MLRYYKKLIASQTAAFFVGIGVHKCLAPIYGGKGHILMLHRILPKENRSRIHNHLSLEITPNHLEEIIKFVIKKKYHIISINEVVEYIKGDRKFVVFTFDDGYKDNLQYAYPIFKKYNCPFTIYICNDFPNKKAFLWWYLLEELLVSKSSFVYIKDGLMVNIKLDTLLKKERIFRQIKKDVNSGRLTLESLKKLIGQYKIDWQSHINEFTLTWENIVELGNDNLVTIGAHTVTHRALKILSEEESYQEMLKSKQEIEDKISKEVKHFCYPFGSKKEVSDRDMELAKKVGFETAITTQLGNVFKDHENQLLSLPTITVNSQTSLAVLKLQLGGFYSMVERWFERVNI